jgi:hypothetical protein
MSLLAASALMAFLPLQDTSGQGNPGFPGLAAGRAPRVEIPWNRLQNSTGIYAHMDRLVAQYPNFLSFEVIGHSTLGREMRVYTLNNPRTGKHRDKPAMWIDGNVHGNEVQGGEAVVYLTWYLLENYGSNERISELMDRSSFYLLPMVNPDGRDSWFADGNTAHSSRTGSLPIDSDQDGLLDEDGPDDLNGDGSITGMRKYVPGKGTYRLNADDPRIMDRIGREDEPGDWVLLGSEGIDNDGDGRTNEDGVGGYDMNRAWPATWQPGHVQRGAGPYPLYWPEANCIATFLYDHPNVAALQSFHNAGGMILRGPGAEVFGEYPRADLRVYDSLGADGEKMLPFYNYMIIWKDLYSVFGGFATWGYEGLGIISFTNELWVNSRNSPDNRVTGRHYFDDNLLMGAGFVDWEPFDHPKHGKVEIGGFKKDVGRVPPSFLIEEMLHRNALFCILHAEAMPIVTLGEPQITDLGGGLLAIDVVIENETKIPTRTALAMREKIGVPDLLTLSGKNLKVIAGGIRFDDMRPESIQLQEQQPERLIRRSGVDGLEKLKVRWFVRGSGKATISFTAEKARDVSLEFQLN